MSIQNQATITERHFKDAKQSAYSLLDNLDISIIYHRKEHTANSVVPASLKIARAEGFSLEDQLIVGVAAAFHDTGFVRQYNSNEPVGAQLAEEYMQKSQFAYTKQQVQLIKDAIMNTNMRTAPQTIYEQVLRDADLAYIGLEDTTIFLQWIKDLQEESKLHEESPLHATSLNEKSWGNSSLAFISQFQKWFTNGAKGLYQNAKIQNINALKEHYGL